VDAPGDRRIELPDGAEMVVRPGVVGDIDGLAALYAGLPDDDIYLRFFSARRPGRELFERMVSVGERGGALLVAEVRGGGHAETPGQRVGEIVGDAWYSLVPDGDGEFAITVAPSWRGWLGAYLLDALLEIAAARGVPNLEAEVLLRNRAMMALVRRRGCVRMGEDGSSVRVAVASAGRIPSWPPAAGHPRALVEGRRSWAPHEEAARRGIEVVVCPGPPARSAQCPALAGGVCPLVEGADAVVLSLAPGDDRTRELVRAHHRLRPGLPVLVTDRSSPPDAEQPVTVLAHTLTDEEVVELVLRELGAAGKEPPR
jgi:GNAT superfamily N-acetyltransferase